MEDELTQAMRARDKANGVNSSPPLVAVVKFDEEREDTLCEVNGQTIHSGEEVEIDGKKFLFEFGINDFGDRPDEVDHAKVVDRISTTKYDRNAKPFPTFVTTSTAVYGHKPGRTWYDADVVLSVDGVSVEQTVDDAHKGSHVPGCFRDDGTPVTWDRYRFELPWTLFGYKARASGKHNPADD